VRPGRAGVAAEALPAVLDSEVSVVAADGQAERRGLVIARGLKGEKYAVATIVDGAAERCCSRDRGHGRFDAHHVGVQVEKITLTARLRDVASVRLRAGTGICRLRAVSDDIAAVARPYSVPKYL
jgi:hypothetical protein